MPEPRTWEHTRLGRFVSDFDHQWIREFDLPAFEAFTFAYHERRAGSSRVQLAFHWGDSDDAEEPPTPSARAVAVAQRVLDNEAVLSDRIRKAVLDDLRGRGRESGMWWHGDLDTIAEQYEHAFPGEPLALVEPADVNALVGRPAITIHEAVYRHDRPVAVVSFEFAIDTEHGLGVLTNGSRILGVGYGWDPSPYKT